MSTRATPDRPANSPSLSWARRVLRQQLDTLARLTIVARRLIEPAAPAPAPRSAAAFGAAALGLQKAVRLQARVFWALRLIAALRARLVGELQALDSGQITPTDVAARSVAADSPPTAATGAVGLEIGRPEPTERVERPERLERERFGFETRASDANLAEILKRPTDEIIALICRELGLPDDWPRLTEEAWARDEADGFEPPCLPQPALSPAIFPRIPAAPS